MKNKKKKLVMGLICGMLMATTSVSAQTRDFVFHMDTTYAHGLFPNCGYAASKADNEQNAYITVTSYNKTSGSPQISMWVAPKGSTSELTHAWTWTGASRKVLGYTVKVDAGDMHQLCAEQFGSGSVVISGRWTP